MKLLNSLQFLPQHPSGLGSRALCAIQERNHAQGQAAAAPSDPTTLQSRWICWKPLTVVVAVSTSLCRRGAGLLQPI